MIKRICASVVLLALAACNYNHVKNENGTSNTQGKITASALSLDFISVQMSVIGPQCMSCHSIAGGNKGGLTLETYDQVRSNMNRIYYRSIEKKDMPPNPLTADQFDLLKNWIEAGAPEKSIRTAARPIKGAINWPVIRDQVLKTSCLDCHSGKTPHAGLDFESLDVVRKNINAIFDSAIIKQTMPLQPYSALSETEKQALMKWISQGMPQ
ncbi:MAG: hypothetical protein ACXVCP_08965 [Bdellovibrio sp.]